MPKYEKAHVYILEGDGRIKLGMSGDPEKRMYSIQLNTVDNLKLVFKTEATEDYLLIERIAHKKLKKFKVKGEWYKVSVQDAINAVNLAIEQIKDNKAEEALTGVKYKYPKITISIRGKANVENLHKTRDTLEKKLGRRLSIRETIEIAIENAYEAELALQTVSS